MTNISIYDDKSIIIEKQVLASLITTQDLIKECELDINMFTYPLHKEIYQKIKDIYNKTGFLDLVELLAETSEEVGNYCTELITEFYSSANFYYRVGQMQDAYKLRLASKVLEKCEKEEIGFDDVVSEINSINSKYVENNNEQSMTAFDIYQLITTDATKLTFKKFNWMQEKIGLIERTLNIIGARTSVGKSAFALNLLNDLADTYKCIYLNMEMTERELYQRLVSMNSGVPIEEFPNIRMKKEKNARVNEAIEQVRKKKIKVYNGSKSISGIRKIISKESRDGHCILFVDYIGYVTTQKGHNDRERIGEATRTLQIMTKDFNCTIFVLAQLNREGTDAPSLTHLKDSGELEQTGHAIMFLHNPSADINNQFPKYDLIIAKNRSGRLGKLSILFEKNIQRFSEI